MKRGGYARLQPKQGSLIDPPQVMTVEQWRKETKRSESEQLHEKFVRDCQTYGLPAPTQEHRFAKEAFGRQWRFDNCWPEFNVAAEIEGLVVKRVWVAHFEEGSPKPLVVNKRIVNLSALRYELKSELVSLGRHASAEGFREDCVKYNTAALLGWTVLRFEKDQVKGKDAIEMTVRVLAAKGWTP